MSDLPCITTTNLVEEKEDIVDDLLQGRALDIVLALLSGVKCVAELAEEIDIPTFSLKLYIDRLIRANVVEVDEEKIVNGELFIYYRLISEDLEIVGKLRERAKRGNLNCDEKKQQELSAYYFSMLSNKIIKSSLKHTDKPKLIQCSFIKAEQEKMEQFLEKLQLLCAEYNELQDTELTETYAFYTTFAYYE